MLVRPERSPPEEEVERVIAFLTNRERNSEHVVGYSEVLDWSPFTKVELAAQLARRLQIRMLMICDNHI